MQVILRLSERKASYLNANKEGGRLTSICNYYEIILSELMIAIIFV